MVRGNCGIDAHDREEVLQEVTDGGKGPFPSAIPELSLWVENGWSVWVILKVRGCFVNPSSYCYCLA